MASIREKQIELIDWLNVIWKRKWLILLPTLLSALVALAVSSFLPKVWEAEEVLLPSKFLVKTEAGQFTEVVVTDPKQIAGQINQESYNTKIAAELGIDPKRFPEIEASVIKDTKLVSIIVRDRNSAQAQAILRSLFNLLKEDLNKKVNVELNEIDTEVTSKKNSIKDMENEIKSKENEIKKRNNSIRLKDLDIQSFEIDKDQQKGEIEASQNKMKISAERVQNIIEEMKSVKARIDALEERLSKVIAEKGEGAEAISLLLYSNEVQQNLRYLGTLDQDLSLEKVNQEDLRLNIRTGEENMKQISTEILQTGTEKEMIKAEIGTIMNEIEKVKNKINTTQSEIKLAQEMKMRFDYTQLVKEPTVSLFPVAPKKRLIVVAVILVGLAIFSLLAFLLEYLGRNRATHAANES